jgi:hypothetical protein
VSDTDGICVIGGYSTADRFLRGQQWQTPQREKIWVLASFGPFSVFTDGIQPSISTANMVRHFTGVGVEAFNQFKGTPVTPFQQSPHYIASR